MGDGDIHPPIFVEIENTDAFGWRQPRAGKERRYFEGSLSPIGKEGWSSAGTSHDQIDGTVIVQVGKRCRNRRAFPSKSRLCGPVGKGLVPVVAPQHVGIRPGLCIFSVWLPGDEQIEIAIMVVIDKRQSGGMVEGPNANFFGDIRKLSMPQISEQNDAVREGHCQIGKSVVVEIAHCTCHAAAARRQSQLRCGNLFQSAIAGTVDSVAIDADRWDSWAGNDQIQRPTGFWTKHAGSAACLLAL